MHDLSAVLKFTSSPLFRTQPIVDAITLNVCACEVLCRNPLRYADRAHMLEIDVLAMQYACAVLAETKISRVHTNVEVTSLASLTASEINKFIVPGMVVEVVERNTLLNEPAILQAVLQNMMHIRERGGLFAMDDVTPSDFELAMIPILRPEILKIVDKHDLVGIFNMLQGRKTIAERIETFDDAYFARTHGATELQGFWCDAIVSMPKIVRSEYSFAGVQVAIA